MKRFLLLGFLAILLTPTRSHSKTSIANEWNEELLFAIRHSRARPTVHARNLYHWSAAAYDAWAAYEPSAKPYLLGDTLGGYPIPFRGVPDPDDRLRAQRKAISYASYRLMKHRYQVSPNYAIIQQELNKQMRSLGYPISDTATSYWDGEPAHLGNYIAEQVIAYGLQDGAHEASNYKNQQYKPLNDTLNLTNNGTPGLRRPNHWQPLQITQRVDQAGNPIKATQSALSPEWGDVDPFALADSNYVTKTRNRNGNDYKVWLDPGPPPYLDTANPAGIKSEYKWNFCMVSIWQSHLDPADTTTWNISPGNIGNLPSYPDQFSRYDSFYNFKSGGGPGLGKGYDVNPATGKPYQPQRVKRADYARILAEYWADGKSSETPPGHWFAIYNEVEEDPAFKRQWKGRTSLPDLAYDLRTYLSLGGAMHDAAVSAWSVKGWYDYVRPVSAIRNMAKQGQCTDPNKRNFDSAGIPLIKDYIELVEPGDPLAGNNGQHVGEIKLYTWRGPDHVQNTETDTAGVGWILAGNWWPYQKPSFVTPPFPGYVSGHSTFSQAAARILTQSTGSPYFPGGKSDFHFEKNEYLEHENGPTEDVTLTYATYKDAADWTALSRIWGGIHPPADDINGRKMGRKAGNYAFQQADSLFSVQPPVVSRVMSSDSMIGRPAIGTKFNLSIVFDQPMKQSQQPVTAYLKADPTGDALKRLNSKWEGPDTYTITYRVADTATKQDSFFFQVKEHLTQRGRLSAPYIAFNPFAVNTQRPKVTRVEPNFGVINDTLTGYRFTLTSFFNSPMDTTSQPIIRLPANQTLIPLKAGSHWRNERAYQQAYYIAESEVQPHSLGVTVSGIQSAFGNQLATYDSAGIITIATAKPRLVNHQQSQSAISRSDQGNQAFTSTLAFSGPMDTTAVPTLGLEVKSNLISLNKTHSRWLSDTVCQVVYRLNDQQTGLKDQLDASLASFSDPHGNPTKERQIKDYLKVDTEKPGIVDLEASDSVVAREHIGVGQYRITVAYDEAMNTGTKPILALETANGQSLEGVVMYDLFESYWRNDRVFEAMFEVLDSTFTASDISLTVNFGEDEAGNEQAPFQQPAYTTLDTDPPEVTALTANHYQLQAPKDSVRLLMVFDEPMNTQKPPVYDLAMEFGQGFHWTESGPRSRWLNPTTFQASVNISADDRNRDSLGVAVTQALDQVGNQLDTFRSSNLLTVRLTGKPGAEPRKSSFVTVHPNPLQGHQKYLTVTLHQQLTDARLILRGLRGRKLAQRGYSSLTPGRHQLQLPAKLPSGTYLLEVRGATSHEVIKVINP